jgi:hypothetical protein
MLQFGARDSNQESTTLKPSIGQSHRLGRPRFNQPPHLLRLCGRDFGRKVAEAPLAPPKLGLTVAEGTDGLRD